MLKTKAKVKASIAFSIILLLLVFSVTTVNATEVTNPTTGTSITNETLLDNVPDTINVGITTSEAIEDGFMSTEMADIIKAKVKEAVLEDITDLEISTFYEGEFEKNLSDISKVCIRLYSMNESYETTTIAEKTISVTYSDWNTADKQYIENKCKNVKMELNNLLVNIDETKSCEQLISEEFSKLINDSSIKCTFYPNLGDWGFPSFYAEGTLMLSKNNVTYYMYYIQGVTGIPSITVPEDIENTEQAIIDYSLSKIKALEHLSEYSLTMKKGTVENEYTLNIEDDEYTVIIEKEEPETVTTTDNKTNIKLNADTTVVPENTVLETKEVKEVKTLNIVKETLKEISTKYTTYDITLKSEGVAIQPNGKVQISIPIPSDYDKTKLTVLRVADDGTKTEYDTKVEGEIAVIETDHFSTYVLAEKNVTDTEVPKTEETAPKGEKDDTPKTGTVEIIYYILPVMIISTLGIIVFRRKETK